MFLNMQYLLFSNFCVWAGFGPGGGTPSAKKHEWHKFPLKSSPKWHMTVQAMNVRDSVSQFQMDFWAERCKPGRPYEVMYVVIVIVQALLTPERPDLT